MGLGASIVSRELSGGRILSSFYELAVLGEIDETVLGDLEKALRDMLHPFGLELGKEVAWSVCPKQFIPEQTNSAAAIFLVPQMYHLPMFLIYCIKVYRYFL
ncbi:hypothetical protein [Klebsiella pneumoniae]|uniref:hypothetical protein n=1 Tax=Klebsiella pneumoniae TaxID=573 RepID=UPI00211AF817|nr:hypothetical protein [Klebsiella pneumoniae]